MLKLETNDLSGDTTYDLSGVRSAKPPVRTRENINRYAIALVPQGCHAKDTNAIGYGWLSYQC